MSTQIKWNILVRLDWPPFLSTNQRLARKHNCIRVRARARNQTTAVIKSVVSGEYDNQHNSHVSDEHNSCVSGEHNSYVSGEHNSHVSGEHNSDVSVQANTLDSTKTTTMLDTVKLHLFKAENTFYIVELNIILKFYS